MSNDFSMKMTMDIVHPASQPRDTNGQIKDVSQQEKDVSVDMRGDILVNDNAVPAKSRIIQEVEPSVLNKAMNDLSQYAQHMVSRDLLFRIDDELGRTVVTVIDAETDEVVRQIPSEEVLSLAKQLKAQSNSSVLVDVKA